MYFCFINTFKIHVTFSVVGVVLLDHKKQNDKKMEKWQMVPPDGGWGWLVLFGATMVNILVPGTIKSFGVLFVEFMEAFSSTPAEGMWIPALCYFLYSSLGKYHKLHLSIINTLVLISLIESTEGMWVLVCDWDICY